MATKRKKQVTDRNSAPKVQTPREMADELRERARRVENRRNDPEVRRAIAHNPQALQALLELERLAAEYRAMADKIEADFGHLSDAEFAAASAIADRLEREQAAGADTVQKGAV